jgi:hypothetical protein
MASGKNPEDWPFDTLVTVMRNALRSGRWGGTSNGRRAQLALAKAGGPSPLGFEPELFEQVRLYPFTKGIDLTNDGLGYGEQTDLTLQCKTGRTEQKASRRTRTGNFCLHLGDPPRAEGVPAVRAPRRSDVVASMPDGGISEEIEPPTVPREAEV